MASGCRFGGVLAADAAPRSMPLIVSTLARSMTHKLTSASPFATKVTGATANHRSLVLKDHLTRALIQGVHNDGHRCCFAFVKNFI